MALAECQDADTSEEMKEVQDSAIMHSLPECTAQEPTLHCKAVSPTIY